MPNDVIAVRLDLEGFRVIETIDDGDVVTAVIETVVPAGWFSDAARRRCRRRVAGGGGFVICR